jgi:hypothetical protein
MAPLEMQKWRLYLIKLTCSLTGHGNPYHICYIGPQIS